MAGNRVATPLKIQVQFISDEAICYWCTHCQEERFHYFTEYDMTREWYTFSCHVCVESGKRTVNLRGFLEGIERKKKDVIVLEETRGEKGGEKTNDNAVV